MEISSKYNPSATENKWYSHWMANKYFHSEPDERTPYTIVIPPPNVTGVLHMGHMLNNTIQDVLIRRARMKGMNACWVPGTDHASIATEAKVVNKLKQEGIDKATLSREEFMKHAWEWRDKHGGIILEQLKRLGASCDWDRTAFTMDESLYESVIDVFIDLFDKGLIYRGVRMVNWDPQALTAVSDEEVIYKEVRSKLYYINYRLLDSSGHITIATTRPETILGDTAICVHPGDERFSHLVGKTAYVPLINREIPIIADEYVDREFGTGALKITPAHDINDYNLGLKHKLPSVDIFNDNGTMSKQAILFVGKDRFDVRKLIVKQLDEEGYINKIENYTNKIGFSERTDAVIEPKISLQWFLKMDQLAKPALDVVEEDQIRFHPAKFKNIYRHWMENVKDWCISRQLWWGQQIPVFYLPDGEMVAAKSKEDALIRFGERFPERDIEIGQLKQDEDVVDTWFSSWLWPIAVFDGIRKPANSEITYYYPTNDLVTAPDIIFFWVARMIMAGTEYRKEIPFQNVYFTGIVRDKNGRKMSKTLGNSPDPIDLIEQFGADGVRMGMLLMAPAGNDLPFDPALCEQGRNFSNKIWNALRLVKGWQSDQNLKQPEDAQVAIRWFSARFHEAYALAEDHFEKYRLSDALMTIYKLIWDDFCSWYLEMIKPGMNQPIDNKTLEATIGFLEDLMKLLHPFMPFITEEIWHVLRERAEGDDIIIARLPQATDIDDKIIHLFGFAEEVINGIRKLRAEKNIPFRESVELLVKLKNEAQDQTFNGITKRLCNLSEIRYVDEAPTGAFGFIARSTEIFIPVTTSVNIEAEIDKLREELAYTKGFLDSVNKKLSNERFVSGAPADVVSKEIKKRDDAQSRIQVIAEQIASFEGK
jgi:valyl-tRNA synthetase